VLATGLLWGVLVRDLFLKFAGLLLLLLLFLRVARLLFE